MYVSVGFVAGPSLACNQVWGCAGESLYCIVRQRKPKWRFIGLLVTLLVPFHVTPHRVEDVVPELVKYDMV